MEPRRVMRSISRSLKGRRTRTVDLKTFEAEEASRQPRNKGKDIPSAIHLTPNSSHAVAQFRPDEILTGNKLPLEDTERHGKANCKSRPNFRFHDVLAIREMHNMTVDHTESMSCSEHDDDSVLRERHHHDDDTLKTARDMVRLQAAELAPGQSQDGNKILATKKPLHKYMIKRVYRHKSSPQQQVQALKHLVQETTILQQFTSHGHHNLITLRGTPMEEDYGNWKTYFVMTDRISETLAQRMHRWRKEAAAPKPKGRFFPYRTSSRKTSPMSTALALDPSNPRFRQKLVYAQNLASVLAFLHSKHIVVRNLHPESIGFLASDDTLQLMDLGQAMEIRHNTDKHGNPNQNLHHNVSRAAGTLLHQQLELSLFQMTPGQGVYRYMAPELLTTIHPSDEDSTPASRKNLPYGYKVDSYSWAMICFELLTLSTPFAVMKAGQHLRQVCLHRPGARPHLELLGLPQHLEHLLQRSWHDHPERRPAMSKIDETLLRYLQ
ncbi:Protein kinase [Seminavis robusta]|uniref:Protein kinase n=1 Tax=Seminavis robusta TaxID=568900 RepID=A0A9N8DT34_9STRA|nr:Protein kinase [Seminavis robusta]|eukprot:Sro331_g119080.1 Protein kinase (494) ;mRNA; f:22906-24387